MVDRHGGPGVVIDLGCSYGRIADVIAEAGRTYIGIDVDDDARASLTERGHESHRLDLAADDLESRLAEIVDGREVSAVLALDVIEHLAAPSLLLSDLAKVFAGWGDPLLVVSVPNVAHRDLAAKLLAGRWDVTEIGLLDRTHLSLFTERRLITEMAERGFWSVDADDMIRVWLFSGERSRGLWYDSTEVAGFVQALVLLGKMVLPVGLPVTVRPHCS